MCEELRNKTRPEIWFKIEFLSTSAMEPKGDEPIYCKSFIYNYLTKLITILYFFLETGRWRLISDVVIMKKMFTQSLFPSSLWIVAKLNSGQATWSLMSFGLLLHRYFFDSNLRTSVTYCNETYFSQIWSRLRRK